MDNYIKHKIIFNRRNKELVEDLLLDVEIPKKGDVVKFINFMNLISTHEHSYFVHLDEYRDLGILYFQTKNERCSDKFIQFLNKKLKITFLLKIDEGDGWETVEDNFSLSDELLRIHEDNPNPLSRLITWILGKKEYEENA